MRALLLAFFFGSIGNTSIQLELIADFAMPQNSLFEKTLIGGLSGLYYKDNLLWAVSDDRGQYNEPRIYSFQISVAGLLSGQKTNGTTGFSVITESVVFLKRDLQKTLKHVQIDAESLVPFEKGWLVSSEGNYHSVPRKKPSLIYFDSGGNFVREIRWPDQFIPNSTGKRNHGLRSNYAFEGLSISPDLKYFFAIHEGPLVQENPTWHAGDVGGVHILRFEIPQNSEKIMVDKDIFYKLDGYQNKGDRVLASGASEILAVSNDKLLILERAIVINSVDFLHFESKIYEVSVRNPSEKKLVLDMGNIKKSLKTTKKLDNFEGMALGPIINNQPTLLVVSDDNFNPLENTIWLLFKLNLEP